jgi:hypothetical protein
MSVRGQRSSVRAAYFIASKYFIKAILNWNSMLYQSINKARAKIDEQK